MLHNEIQNSGDQEGHASHVTVVPGSPCEMDHHVSDTQRPLVHLAPNSRAQYVAGSQYPGGSGTPFAADHDTVETHENRVGSESNPVAHTGFALQNGSGDGAICAADQLSRDSQKNSVGRAILIASRAEMINGIIADHRTNRNAMAAKNRILLAAQARAKSLMGFSTHSPEADRKAISARAAKLMKAIEAEKRPDVDGDIYDQALPFIRTCLMAMAPFEFLINDLTKSLSRNAKTLPIQSLVESISGVGFAGVAAIIGEAGADLSEFPSHQHLWKRLGLAVVGGRSQGNAGPSAKSEDYIEHGYNPQRRSIVRSCIGTPLMLRGEKNSYRPQYDEYKARIIFENESGAFSGRAAEECARAKRAGSAPNKHNLEGRLTPAHINARALRYMEKCFIRDLWCAWHDADQVAMQAVDKPSDPS